LNKKTEDSHFEKNGRVIIPNPWRRYGLLIPKLSFYYELYNIQNPAIDKSLSIDYSIINKDNIEVKSLSGVEVKKTGENISVVHAVDINGLVSGIYTLKAEITDTETNQECSLSRSFEIIQIDYLQKNLRYLKKKLRLQEICLNILPQRMNRKFIIIFPFPERHSS
jgi:hypothetical protein